MIASYSTQNTKDSLSYGVEEKCALFHISVASIYRLKN